MRKIVLILSTLFYSYALYAQTVKYPPYEEVVSKFYQAYDTDTYEATQAFAFGKTPEGWKLFATTLDSLKISTYVVWSSQTGKWKDIGFERNSSYPTKGSGYENSISKKYYLYDVSPYYGYEGWYDDVIALLEKQPSLSDTLLYALAKAYNEKGNALIGNQYGFSTESSQKRTKLPPNSLDEKTLDEYMLYAYKAIAVYKKMETQNPNFETFVGYMNLQISNEYMSNWLNLYIWQNEETANQFLVDNLYDNFMLDFASNTLISCPKNAILFTNGDSDTYSLLYAQKKLKIRPDVVVVNLSLLNLAEYVSVLSTHYKLFKKSIADDDLISKPYDYVYFAEGGNRLDASKLNTLLELYSVTNSPIFAFPSNKFAVKCGGKKIDIDFKNYYLLRGELAELDIIAQNANSRPICYAVTTAPAEPYEKYMFLHGFVYVMDGKAKKGDPMQGGSFADAKKHIDLLANKILFTEYAPNIYKTKAGAGFVYNMKLTYVNTAVRLLTDNDKKGASAIITRMENAFPIEKCEFSYVDLWVAYVYASLGKKGKGNIYCTGVKKYLQSLQEGDVLYPGKEESLKVLEQYCSMLK